VAVWDALRWQELERLKPLGERFTPTDLAYCAAGAGACPEVLLCGRAPALWGLSPGKGAGFAPFASVARHVPTGALPWGKNAVF
jgi:hypothetical protein